jgi:hypothetical protein
VWDCEAAACRKSHSKCTATWTSSMPQHQHAASPFSSGEACQLADSPRGMDCVVLPSQSICGSLSERRSATCRVRKPPVSMHDLWLWAHGAGWTSD